MAHDKNALHILSTNAFGFLTSYISTDKSRLGRGLGLPIYNLWELLVQDFVQAGCSSCCPTKNVKALKEFSILS